MDLHERKRLRRYLKISFLLHAGVLALMAAGEFFSWGKPLQYQPSVQIDMVALPDLVKSDEVMDLDKTLPVRDQPPPPSPPEAAPEKDEMVAPKEPDDKKELALRAEKKAQEEAKKRRAQRAAEDVFTNLPADLVSAKAKAQAQTNGAQV